MQLNEIMSNTARLEQVIPQKQTSLQERNRLSMEIQARQQEVEREIQGLDREREQCSAEILMLQSGGLDENGELSAGARMRIAQLESRQGEILRRIQELGRTRDGLRARRETVQSEIRAIEAALQGYGRELQQLLSEVEQNIAATNKAWQKLQGMSTDRFAAAPVKKGLEDIRRHLTEAGTQRQKILQLMRLLGMTASPQQPQGIAQFWQESAQEETDAADWDVPEEVSGGRSRGRSMAQERHIIDDTIRPSPIYTTQQEPAWQAPAQPEELLRKMRGSPAPTVSSAEEMARKLGSSQSGGKPDFPPAHYQARFASSHPFGEFEAVQSSVNQGWTVAGRHYQEYQEYLKNEDQYEKANVPPRICTVNLDLVEGINLSEWDIQNPDRFWKMRNKNYSFESYREIASRIPDVKRELAAGRPLQEIYHDPDEKLRLCANLYFKPKAVDSPSLSKVDDFYILNGEGRHRLLAAWSLGYSFPMEVRTQYVRK